MISAIRHTGIVVRDLRRQRAFYEGLGLVLASEAVEDGAFIETVVGLEGAVVDWVKLRAPDGALVELLRYNAHPIDAPIAVQPSNQLGCSHIAFTVKDAQGAADLVLSLGGSIVNRPATNPAGTVQVFYCHDPEGNLLELVQVL